MHSYAHSSRGMSPNIILAILLAVGVLGAAIYWKFGYAPGDPSDGIAAVVNGEEILIAEVDQLIKENEEALIAEGLELTSTRGKHTARSRVVEEMIDTILLRNAALDKEIMVPPEIINNTLSETVASYGTEAEATAELQKRGLTLEILRVRLHEQLLIAQYLSGEIPNELYAATAEEIQSFYNANVGEIPDAPSLESLREAIKVQIEQDKFATLYRAHVSRLRDNADIDVRL